MSYVYDHFYRSLMSDDYEFRHGPGPGEAMPHFELPTVDGPKLRKQDFIGVRPLVLVFGSLTCPMTKSALPVLKALHAELGRRVGFALLYVREAHPGDRTRQPRTFDEKMSHARALKERDRIPFPIAVDDIEGLVHRSLDPKPNAVYIMDDEGKIAYRTLWASDESALREGIALALSRKRDRRRRSRQGTAMSLLAGVGALDETLAEGGPEADRDMRSEAPAVWALAKIARVYRPLTPTARAVAALATVGAGVVLLGIGLSWLVRRR